LARIPARCCSTASAASAVSPICSLGSAPHYHRQDRAVPQDPANRAADRPPLRLAPPRPTGPGCLG
jgi:hypothetical protein